MDKYEYKLRLEEIKTLNKKGRFQESAQIADTIDWKKVRNTSTLGIISDVYKINRRFDDAREILLLANEKSPQNRRIVYALCDLAIKTGQVVEAVNIISSLYSFRQTITVSISCCIKFTRHRISAWKSGSLF